MSQAQALEFMRKHPNKWLSLIEMVRTGEVTNAAEACRRLARFYKEIEIKADFARVKYKYNPKIKRGKE